MQKVNPATLLCAFIMLCGCNNSNNSNNEKIKLQLKLGKGYEQTFITETTTKSNNLGEVTILNEVKFWLDSITAEGSYIISGRYINMKYNSNIGGETESFDSKKKESEMTPDEKDFYYEVKPLLDSDFSFVLNQRGEVIKPVIFQNGYVPGSAEELTNLPLVFPENEINMNQEWSNEVTDDLLKNKTISKYKVNRIENDKIYIGVVREIGQISGVLEKTEAHGEYILDKKTNTLIKGEREMKMQIGGGKVIYKIYQK